MEHLATVHREPGRVSVVLRPYRRSGIVWGCLAVALVAAALLLVGMRPGVRVPDLVLIALLGIAAYASYGAALATAWHLVGREVVTATPVSLTIEHFIVRRRRTQQYSASKVTNLRARGAGHVIRRGHPVRAAPALAFEYDAQTVSFGGGMAGAAAEALATELAMAMEPPTANARLG